MTEIVTLTMNPAVDKSTRVDRVAPDRKLRCESPRREPGGGGLNVSRALRRLDQDSLALFLSGGAMGEILQGLLEEEEVKFQALATHAGTRENLMVREEGEEDHQYRFDMPGPEIRESEWKEALERIRALDPPPAYVVASGSLPPGVPDDFYARLARVVREVEGKMILDTSGAGLREGLKGGVYLVKPNLRELKALAEDPSDSGDYEDAQARLAEEIRERQWAEAVVVSMGSAGALLVAEGEREKVSTPTVPIRSRVGAGDSMVAGLVAGLSRGMDLPTATRYGVAAGAAAVMTPGTELCRKPDVEDLFDRM